MRAQTSFEFLICLAVSATALVLALSMYIKGSGMVAGIGDRSALEELVASINANTGFQTASFVSYVPYSACGARLNKTGISLENESYSFSSSVSISAGQLCEFAGRIARVDMAEFPNGTFQVVFSEA